MSALHTQADGKEMTTAKKEPWATLAGTSAFLGGLLHIIALLGGADWIHFFHAPPSVVESARQGTWLAPVSTLLITALMWLCSLYAFSAAGFVHRLPLLRTGLFVVAFICVVRGLIFFPLIMINPAWLKRLDTFEIVASVIWLAIGIFFALGLRAVWKRTY